MRGANLPRYETTLELCRYGGSSAEIASARLYVALRGHHVSLERMGDGLDHVGWFIRAMMEVGTDGWRGVRRPDHLSKACPPRRRRGRPGGRLCGWPLSRR